jgi:hypothetical protein
MSYFMTVSGIAPDLSGLEPVEFVEAAKAQYYIERLAEQLTQLDGGPLFLVDDGHSGTSDDLVSPAVSSVRMGEPIENTPLNLLLNRLSTGQHTLRIWYAGRVLDAHLRVKYCGSLEEAMREFRDQPEQTGMVGICARV